MKTDKKQTKKFKGNRPLDEIKKAVLAKGWPWDQAKYDDGGDYLTFGFVHEREHVLVVYNTFNGTFIGRPNNGEMFTERDTHMDGTPWYDALLDFIYQS